MNTFKFMLMILLSFAVDARAEGDSKKTCEVIVSGKYTVHNPGTAVGTVQVMSTAEFRRRSLFHLHSHSHIAVVPELPSDLKPSLLAGIVTSQPIAPGNHWELQARRSGTPLVSLQDAIKNPEFLSLAERGGIHSLTFEKDRSVVAVEADLGPDAIQNHFDANFKPIAEKPPSRKLTQITTLNLSQLDQFDLTNDFGEKVEGIWRASGRGANPGGLPEDPAGLPFGAYFEYLSSVAPQGYPSLEIAIQETMSRVQSEKLVGSKLEAELKKIDSWFQQLEIPEAMLERYHQKLVQIYGSLDRWIYFRSSGLIENKMGAGLHSSVIYKGGKTKAEQLASLSKVIREVWASPYDFDAFQFRRFYRLDERNVAMAILIHPYEDAVFEGVATASYSFGEEVFDVVIHRGSSATSPVIGSEWQEFRVKESPAGSGDLVLSVNGSPFRKVRSNQKKLLLSTDQLGSLQNQLHGKFGNWWGYVPSPERSPVHFEWFATPQKIILSDAKPMVIENDENTVSGGEYSRWVSPRILQNYEAFLSMHPREQEFEHLAEDDVFDAAEMTMRFVGSSRIHPDVGLDSTAFVYVQFDAQHGGEKRLFLTPNNSNFSNQIDHGEIIGGLNLVFGEESYQVLEMGRVSFKVSETADHLQIYDLELTQAGNPPFEVELLGADRSEKSNLKVVTELLNEFVKNDVIGYAPGAKVYGRGRFGAVISNDQGQLAQKFIQKSTTPNP